MLVFYRRILVRLPLVVAILVLLHLLPVRAATMLQYGQPTGGTLAAGQKETYSFNGKTGEKLVITMNAHGGSMIPYIALYNPQGQLIGEDSNGGPKGNALLKGFVLPADGAYTVEAVNRAQSGDGKYGLEVQNEQQQVFFDGSLGQPAVKEAYQLSQPWDHKNITYTILNTLSGFNPQDVQAVLVQAFQAWAAVAPITFTQVQGQGDINVQFGSIDGAYNILGETCPPYNPCDSGSVLLDSDETWALTQPQGYGDVSLLAVATHELGHAVGMLHTDDPNALMYPEYSPYVLQPEQDDIAGVQRLYGVGGAGPVNNPPSLPVPGVPSPNNQAPQMQVSGQLDDQHYAHFWDFDVVAGDTVTIDMSGQSGDLDSFLVLLDAQNHVLAYDDDTGGGKNAELHNLQFPQAGTYTVAATRYAQAQGYTTGTYVLSIQYDVGAGGSSAAPPIANTPAPASPTGTVKVSAGQSGSQLPTIDSILESPFASGAVPGEQARNGTVDVSQSYTWNQTWCATDAQTLQNNLPNITVQFKVNGEPVDASLVKQSQLTSGKLQCEDYAVVLSDWTPGTVALTATLTLRAPVFDGQTIFAPGDYVYQYSIQAR